MRKTLSIEAATDARVELAIDSDHEHPIAVRIREPLPDGLEPSAIEFSEDDGDSWWVFGSGLEFSRIIETGETTRTAYVAHRIDAASGAGLVAPTIEVVSPVDPEDAENGDVPLWRGRAARTTLSAIGNGRNDSDTRPNGHGSTGRSNGTAPVARLATQDASASATGIASEANGRERTTSSTDAGVESRSFELPSVDVGALGSALRNRLESLVSLDALRRPVRETILSDDAFDVLSNARRRRVLMHLFETDEPTTLSDLSRSVAAWENSVSEGDITSQQRKRVYTALRQNHLPKMDRASVIDYDRDRGSIAMTDEGARLQAYLDVSIRRWSWERYYLLLGVLWCGAVLVFVSGIVPSSPASGFILAGLIGFSVVCSALAQIYARTG